jgi:general stress protein 26
MTDLERAGQDPEGLLWDKLESVPAGMLGIAGSGQHMQPMVHHVDRQAGCLWFVTRRDSDLAEAMTGDSKAHFVIISKEQEFHACMSGPIMEEEDMSVLDRIWSPAFDQLFPQGKDDPALMMIALKLDDAAIWASSQGAAHFDWDSNDTGEMSGRRNHVRF